eukprot:5870857-Pleurochrysis_carterae.AAC.1
MHAQPGTMRNKNCSLRVHYHQIVDDATLRLLRNRLDVPPSSNIGSRKQVQRDSYPFGYVQIRLSGYS